MARGQPDRRVAANWEPPSRSQHGGARRAAGIRASGARTTLPTTGYDGAPKHQGNAFATRPHFTHFINENEPKSDRL